MTEYNAIVVGAGPGGSAAAMYLGKAEKKVLLIDKSAFPRDKICGDAQGRRASSIFKELGIYKDYLKIPGQKIYGLTLSSPNGTQIDLDVAARDQESPGWCHKRQIFDSFFFEHAKKFAKFKALDVTDVIVEDGFAKGIKGKNEKGEVEEYRASLLLAADGATSRTAHKFGLDNNPQDHLIVATRQYWKGVKGLTDRIEIHLIKHLLPGYFWIFPLPNGEANVGLGMITKARLEKKVNLKEAQLKEIKENPLFKERFKDAIPLEDVKGWSLPVASHHRKPYGNGFMLLGDAASLIDPLSGEGLGNAMVSGKIAAKIAVEALEAKDFSEEFLKKYDEELWKELGEAVKTSYRVQKTAMKFPFLIDALMAKAKKDENFRKKIEKLLPYTSGREEIVSDKFLEELKVQS